MDDSYLAGLFDGEGCIAVRWYKRRYETTSISISVTMTDEAPVQCFANRFGGKCKVLARKTSRGRSVYKWELTGTTAELAIRVLAQGCLSKKSQLELALQVVDSLKWGHRTLRVSPEENLRRRDIADRIKYLKHEATYAQLV